MGGQVPHIKHSHFAGPHTFGWGAVGAVAIRVSDAVIAAPFEDRRDVPVVPAVQCAEREEHDRMLTEMYWQEMRDAAPHNFDLD